MKQTLKEICVLLTRFSISLLACILSKIIFFIFNRAYFTDVSVPEFIAILFRGLRFDVSALVVINAPFILFHIIPFNFTKTKWYQATLKIIFILVNAVGILADCIDLEYYKYTHKRTTADFFDLLGLGSDVTAMLPQYIQDFWYILLIWITQVILITWLYNKTNPDPDEDKLKFALEKGAGPFLLRAGTWLAGNAVLLGLFIICFRGGLQLRPIMPINAAEYVSAKNIPLVISTPFSIIKSYGLEKIEEKKYFPETELEKIFNPIHSVHPQAGMYTEQLTGQPNIFIIILESFSKEYIGALSSKPLSKTYTPFLDSLIGESLVFDNAFANGKKSIEGIPAILAGIPSLMNESYITSTYCSNKFTSIANMLKDKGYSSAFFHGGTNGTMGFDAFCNAAGFDNYYGRYEYNNDKDFDGDWGIWDEDFFRYTERTVSRMQQPFLATLFSLSSHHPCYIPEKYKEKFKEGPIPILKSIEYADFSLRKFFEAASKEKWFDSTLFVITADHTGPSLDERYNNNAALFKVPILLYKHKSSLKGINHKVAQHIDILPTILHCLNNEQNFYSFGNSMLDSTKKGFAVNYINDVYQIFEGDFVLLFDGLKEIGFHNYKTDSLLQNNLLEKEPAREKDLEDKLKAIIQTYNHDLIHNQMTVTSGNRKNKR